MKYQGNISPRDCHNKDRNGRDLVNAEEIKKRWKECTELYKKGLSEADNYDGVVSHPEPDILECEVKWALGSITAIKLVDAMARNRAHQGMGVRAGQKAADSDGKVAAYNAGDPGLNPGLGRSPGEGNGNPLQYSCLENPMDGGAWWATVHGVQRLGHDWATSLSIYLDGSRLL